MDKSQYLVGIPDDAFLQPDMSRDRITDKQVATVLKCIIGTPDAPKKMELTYVSKVMGGANGHLLADAADYKMAFFVRDGIITNCFRCVTPSGKEYNAAADPGQPVCNHLKMEEWHLLRQMLRSFNESGEERRIGVVCRYRVMIDVGTERQGPMSVMFDKGPTKAGMEFPKELRSFYADFDSEEEATKVAEKATRYFKARNEELAKTRKKK